MFKTKNKKVEDRPPERSQTPQPAKPKKKLFGRRRDEPEPVPQLDLAAALPSSDDFRTSLLMPSLSTRFSMLREQDDPNSILGKANDDSVLHARGKSRLGGFGDTGLSDIAETASIDGSIRPPFASNGRSASYTTDASIVTDDDASTNGSVMSRARPGEGNMLFGGRQKIYKIPVGDAGSVKNLGGQEQRGMRGRALYEDDVHVSSFQKYREQERQAEREKKLEQLEREMLHDEFNNSSLNSPSLSAHEEKRDTTSSTNSGPSRISGSTAATSIISHGPASGSAAQSPLAAPHSGGSSSLARSNSRRLYDSHVDQHIYEQQHANLTRINSMQRKTSLNSRSVLHGSRSATNLRERFGPPPSTESSRAASPLPPMNEKLTTFDSVKSPTLASHSPVSPAFDPDNPLAQAVDARDRGKATALGQFNRPKKFDEQQFLQRQRSLHQQNQLRNESRAPRPPTGRSSNEQRRPSVESKPFFPPRRPSGEAQSRNGSVQTDHVGFIPRPRAGTARSDRYPSVDSQAKAGMNGIPSDSMQASKGARARNFSGPSSPAAARLIRPEPHSPMSQSPVRAGRQEPPLRNPHRQQPVSQYSSATHGQGTAFYDSPEGSNNESPLLGTQSPAEASPKISLERGTRDDIPPPLSPPQLRDHPALRDIPSQSSPVSPLSPSKDDRRKAVSPEVMMHNFVPPISRSPSAAGLPAIGVDVVADAAPQDGSASPNKLNGLIREHLRHTSTASSIYPANDEDHNGNGESDVPDLNVSETLIVPDENVNPWLPKDEPESQTDGFAQTLFNPDNIGVAVTSPSQQHHPTADLPPGPRPGDTDEWMNELRKQHTREASSETQHERQAFAEDIKLRQKAIQENLRIKNELGPRSPSPGNVREKQNMFESGLKPFGLLRKQSSREEMTKKKTGLGISAQGARPAPLGAANKFRQPPMGRTLHMRIPDISRPSEESQRGRSGSGSRKASDAYSTPYQTPPESGRTSIQSNEVPSSRPSDAGSDIRRSDFPSGLQSAHLSARPSLETMRQRSDSGAVGRYVPPVPPLRTNNGNPARPPMAQLSTTASVPSTTAASPITSAQSTPPLSSTSMSSPELRGQTNTSLSQVPHATNSPMVASTLPTSVYAFPPRADKDRPAAIARRTGRSNTINKQDISPPTLISSTSNFETMGLDAKRQQLQAMSMGNFGMQSPPPPPSYPQAVPSPSKRTIFGRKSSETTRVSSDDSSGQSGKGKQTKDSEGEEDFINHQAGGRRLQVHKVSSEDGGMNNARRREPGSGQDGIAGGMI